MAKQIKLVVASPGVTDGVSYYRAAGPISRLRQQMDLQVEYPPAFGWHDVKSADLILVQRPGAQDHEKVIRYSRECGIPVWVDMDDDLLDVPGHNPGWETFKDRSDIVKSCLRQASIVTTATEHLAKKFREYNQNVEVIPNALDERLLKGYDPLSKKTEPRTIYWRGASGHIKDLFTVQDDIVAIADEFPDVRWQFHGYWPWHVFNALCPLNKNIVVDHIKATEVIEYFSYIKNQANHSIAIVPLDDSEWNRHKSNISWIENTFAGATCLTPDFDEFSRPGVIHYKQGSFRDSLRELLLNPPKRKVQESLDYILDNLTLTKVNQKRAELIEKLLQDN